jgi:single-strand DNA-binding protein
MATATIVISARLARDPELRQSNNGNSVCRITLPVDTGFGENKETTWWTATLFGKKAEAVARYLKKGQWVTVTGEPKMRQYTKRDGEVAFSAELVAYDFGFVGNKSDDGPSAGPTRSAPKRKPATTSYSDASDELVDLPF